MLATQCAIHLLTRLESENNYQHCNKRYAYWTWFWASTISINLSLASEGSKFSISTGAPDTSRMQFIRSPLLPIMAPTRSSAILISTQLPGGRKFYIKQQKSTKWNISERQKTEIYCWYQRCSTPFFAIERISTITKIVTIIENSIILLVFSINWCLNVNNYICSLYKVIIQLPTKVPLLTLYQICTTSFTACIILKGLPLILIILSVYCGAHSGKPLILEAVD